MPVKEIADYKFYAYGGVVSLDDQSIHDDRPYPPTGNDKVNAGVRFFDIKRIAEGSGRHKFIDTGQNRFYNSISLRKYIALLERAAELMEEAERKGYDSKKGI